MASTGRPDSVREPSEIQAGGCYALLQRAYAVARLDTGARLLDCAAIFDDTIATILERARSRTRPPNAYPELDWLVDHRGPSQRQVFTVHLDGWDAMDWTNRKSADPTIARWSGAGELCGRETFSDLLPTALRPDRGIVPARSWTLYQARVLRERSLCPACGQRVCRCDSPSLPVGLKVPGLSDRGRFGAAHACHAGPPAENPSTS